MSVLSCGIPLARQYPDDFQSMWPQLAESLDRLLFPNKYLIISLSVFRIRAAFLVIFFIFLCRYLLCRVSTPSDGEFTKEQLIEDEAVDCQIVKFLKKEILSQSNSVPKEFVLKVVMLLTKGSVLSPAHDVIISEYSRRSGCGWTVTVAFHFTLHN